MWLRSPLPGPCAPERRAPDCYWDCVTYKSSVCSKGPAGADVVNAKAAIQKNAPTKILVMVRSIPKGRFSATVHGGDVKER